MEIPKTAELFYALKANQQIFEVLEASKTVTDRVFDDLPMVLVMADDHGRLLKLNAVGQRVLATEEKAVLGTDVAALLPESSAARIRAYFSEQLVGEVKSLAFEDTIFADGESRYYRWRVARAFDSGRRRVHALIGDDLTTARNAIQALVEVQRDLEVASAVQSMLVPPADEVHGQHFAMVGHFEPAQQVGGDLWWHTEIPGLGMLVVVADITGHGMASAMVAATFIGALSASAALRPPANAEDLPRFFKEIGLLLTLTFRTNFLVCFAGALFLSSSPKVALIGAGFPPALKISKGGKVQAIALRGNPLGLQMSNHWNVTEAEFAPGDRVVCFSDGCYEDIVVPNNARRMHFQSLLSLHAGLPLVESRAAIVADHRKIRAPGPLQDDITFVMIEGR